MWSAWPWVIAMWVGSTSSAVATATGLFGFRNGSTSSGRLAVAQLEAGMAVELDLHLSSLPFGSVWSDHLFSSLQCPADGDSNHHPHPRLLGEQGADRGDPLVGVGDGRGAQGLGLVRLAEPAALGERGGEDLLQLRRRAGDDPLGLGEALRVEQPLDRRFELALVGHAGSLGRTSAAVGGSAEAASPARPPTAPPTRPATKSAVGAKSGSAIRTDGGDRRRRSRRTPRRSPRGLRSGGSRTRRRPRRAPSRCRRRSP